MSDLLQVADLEKAKLHDTFHSEVITGKVYGLSGGADINLATNAVTGQVQATLPAILRGLGFARVGTFAAGATLTDGRQTLLFAGDGQEYGWTGTFPKVVPVSSTPTGTGGIANGAWVSRYDPITRAQSREALRRTYAESGLTLVDGSFEDGGMLTSSIDVLLQESSTKAYGWEGAFPKLVTAGSSVAGFVDKSHETLVPNQLSGEYQAVKAAGNYAVSTVVTSMSDAYLFNGMYYILYGQVNLPYTIVSPEPDPLVFKCCGILNGYPLNDIRNFGAKPYPEYSHTAINLAIKFINPYVWRGTIANTYTNGPMADGTVIIPQGWWRCGEKLSHNPGVRLMGVAPARRIYGRNTPQNSLLGSVIIGDSPTVQNTYLIDTANYNSTGVRLFSSSDYITGAQVDVDGLYAASEGSMLENLYIVYKSGFFGGFRQHWAMRGGYRNVSVGGFRCNASCNQIWNQITNGLWSEESDIPLMITESTTQVFDGPHTLLGKGSEMPSTYDNFPTFLSGMMEDGSTLALGQKLVSRCLFVAYCEHPVFTALVTEYSVNPILVRDTVKLELVNYHEEVNGVTGWGGYKSVFAGWASSVEVSGVTSLSNVPMFAMGGASTFSLVDTVQQVGSSHSLVGFATTSVKLILNTDVLPAEIYRAGEVVFLRNKPKMYVKYDGNPKVYGHNAGQPTTIDSAIKHLSTKGCTTAKIELIGEVIREAGGYGIFDSVEFSGEFPLTHSASAPEFTLATRLISKENINEYMNSKGFVLESRQVDITHKNCVVNGAFPAYQTYGAHSFSFTCEGGGIGTTIFGNATSKIHVLGASKGGGATPANLVSTPSNALLSFLY